MNPFRTLGRDRQGPTSGEILGQLEKDPEHHFRGGDLQIFSGTSDNNRRADVQGFVKSYFTETNT